jgi:arylsulfatase A-like enzyme
MPGASPFLPKSLRRFVFRLFGATLVVGIASTVAAPSAAAQDAPDDRPSVLLIVTDDQRWDTMWAMPRVEQSLADRGVTFTQAFTTSSLCCPSRASILTGAYPHTTGVYRQAGTYGGFRAFDDSTTLATSLDAAGYSTAFFGKYLDAYQSAALSGYVPPGWDRWVAFVHSQYEDYGLTVDGQIQRYGSTPEDYSTEVLVDQAESFIRGTGGPLFALFAPAAPHAPATPADVDRASFEDLPAWRPPSFDEPDRTDKPAYVQAFRPVGPERTASLEELRRNQYRTLQAVDRAVERLLDALEDTGRLDDALVIFTTDNGLQWGEHRWLKKEVPYEEAIRVPLVVRADAIVDAGGRVDDHLVANIDLAPTIASAAGIDLPGADGRSLVPLLRGQTEPWRRALLIEHMRGTNPIPTYCGVRTQRHLFVTYETGERELYDLEVDPYELENLAGTRPDLEARLGATLKTLCDPPPPGLGSPTGVAFTILVVGALVLVSLIARFIVGAPWRRPLA